jgi:hypothetical protein
VPDDPLTDITTMEQVSFVMKGGVIIDLLKGQECRK